MIKINIHNETAKLKMLIVGIADSFGGVPSLCKCIDPKSKRHVLSRTFPKQKDVLKEMNALIKIFEKHNINVFRPYNIQGLNQIFPRDILVAKVIKVNADHYIALPYVDFNNLNYLQVVKSK